MGNLQNSLWYRFYYRESVNSIKNYVDKIFIFYSEEPWVKTDSLQYKNATIKFPKILKM